jgi:hypothetical protein
VVPWVRLEIGFYSFLYCPRVEVLGWMDVEEVSSLCKLMFLGKEKGHFFLPG